MIHLKWKNEGPGGRIKSVLAVVGLVAGGLLLFGLIAFGLAFAVQYLWNWLMPTLFDLPTVTYWQAFGLLLLSHLLLKGHHRGGADHDPAHGTTKNKASIAEADREALARDVAQRVKVMLKKDAADSEPPSDAAPA